MKSKKRLVYVMATLTTMAVFLPFQSHVWALYAGACSGYTILVFGLRRAQKGLPASSAATAKPASVVLLTHLAFLAIVTGWVWLAVTLKPYLPYFLRTDDTSHPYFGLAFVGILGLLLLEAIEQRWLSPDVEIGAVAPGGNAPQR